MGLAQWNTMLRRNGEPFVLADRLQPKLACSAQCRTFRQSIMLVRHCSGDTELPNADFSLVIAGVNTEA